MAGAQARWVLVGTLLALSLHAQTQARNICPTKQVACQCSVKSKGLVLICEKIGLRELKEAMQVFREYPSTVIQYLTLRHTDMPRLPNNIFMGLDIRHLIVSITNLQVLEDRSLTALESKLEILDLSQNWIHEVPSKAVRHLPRTRLLTLNHNNISALAAGAFDGMRDLDRLAMYANSISRIDVNAFRGLSKLTYLNLGLNQLDRVPTEAVAKIPNLINLELQENRIKYISENDFAGLSNLDTLKISHNQIAELGPFVFRNLPRMSNLDLEYNRIRKIHDTAFQGLEEKLEWLKMGHNEVGVVPSAALQGMHRLREFDFKSNNISQLSEDSFEGFGRTIKFMYLQNNRIRSLPMSVFSEMHSLEHLSLANNSIQSLPSFVFQPIIETVKVIDVHENHLSCDCNLLWYKQWMIKTENDKVQELALKTYCWSKNPKHQYEVVKAPIEKGCQSSSKAAAAVGDNLCAVSLALLASCLACHRQ